MRMEPTCTRSAPFALEPTSGARFGNSFGERPDLRLVSQKGHIWQKIHPLYSWTTLWVWGSSGLLFFYIYFFLSAFALYLVVILFLKKGRTTASYHWKRSAEEHQASLDLDAMWQRWTPGEVPSRRTPLPQRLPCTSIKFPLILLRQLAFVTNSKDLKLLGCTTWERTSKQQEFISIIISSNLILSTPVGMARIGETSESKGVHVHVPSSISDW